MTRITNLETSNADVWSNLNLKASLVDPVFTNNVTISGNLTVSGTTTTVDTENLLVKDPIITVSNAATGVDSGILINRPTNNIFAGFLHDEDEYTLGLTENSGLDASITIRDDVGFVANVHGNVRANYFFGDGSLLTGVVSSGGGASTLQAVTDLGNVTTNVVQFTNTDTSLVASGDIEAKNIQLNDPSITTTFASGMLTIDAANKTYGTGSLIALSENMTALSYSNLIEGSQVIIPITSSGGDYTVSNAFSNVDYHVYPDVATVTAGNRGLMTVSNLNGNVYMNMLPFQDLPTGTGGGGGGYTTGDLTVSGGLTVTDLDVAVSVTGNVITLDGGNKTFGMGPLLNVNSNLEHLVFSNLIHGSEIKLPMNAFTDFSVENISNVNRYFFNTVTVSQNNIAIMTVSNIHGSIYADMKISSQPAIPSNITKLANLMLNINYDDADYINTSLAGSLSIATNTLTSSSAYAAEGSNSGKKPGAEATKVVNIQNFTVNTTWTIVFWLYSEIVPDPTTNRFLQIMTRDSYANTSSSWRMYSYGEELGLYQGTAGGWVSSGISLSQIKDKWTLIAVTSDNYLKIKNSDVTVNYYNIPSGFNADGSPTTDSLTFSTTSLFVPPQDTYYDDIRIYNTILTNTELNSIYSEHFP